VREAHLVLGVIGAAVRRVVGQEFPELVDRQDQRLAAALAEIGVADAELGVGPIHAAGVRFDDLLVVLPRGEPLLRVEGRRALVEEKLVRFERARGHRALRGGEAAGRARQGHDEQHEC
jgi:hypothetical protein